jgi:single-stranded-DNA-specific exonuclease
MAGPVAVNGRKRWLLPSGAAEAAVRLARELKLGPLAARVLARRGFTDVADARAFLRPSLDQLHDPLLMAGMAEALARLRGAIASKEKVLIYGDYDVDGTTSVVILKKAIEMAGGTAVFHVPHRLKDGYGMRAEVVEDAAAQNVKLIVSVDTGIRAAEVVRRASELAIDVIITDHHLPEAELPPALAVLNPNRPGCAYPEKNLCGVGVAFKLVQALLGGMGWPEEKLRRTLESFLKLVAIGTVADVVPLTGENRVIVKHGLDGLDKVKNPGLRALLDVAGFPSGTAPTAGQVAFRVAPRINAAGRMATANDVIEMFLTADPARARELAERLHTLNGERQQTEQKIVAEILERCLETPVTDADAALVFAGEGWHRGVLGIVASRVVERFHRPAFVLGVDAETGVAQGSGRSIERFHLLEALEAMPELFTKFGGHYHAAGLTMPASRVDEFRSRFGVYAGGLLTPEDFVATLAIDAEVEFQELQEPAIIEVLGLGPFGTGNPQPVFAAMGLEVAGPPVIFGEKHLRIPLRQRGKTLWLKAWNLAGQTGEFSVSQKIDVSFTLEEDSCSLARGYPGWSGTLRDFRVSRV